MTEPNYLVVPASLAEATKKVLESHVADVFRYSHLTDPADWTVINRTIEFDQDVEL